MIKHGRTVKWKKAFLYVYAKDDSHIRKVDVRIDNEIAKKRREAKAKKDKDFRKELQQRIS